MADAEWRNFFKKELLFPAQKDADNNDNDEKKEEASNNELKKCFSNLSNANWIESRTDDYIVIGDQFDIGLKLRHRTKIELKERYKLYDGNIEDWSKITLGKFEIETILSDLTKNDKNGKKDETDIGKEIKKLLIEKIKKKKEKKDKHLDDICKLLKKYPCCIVSVSKKRSSNSLKTTNDDENDAYFEFAECNIKLVTQWNTKTDIKSKIDNQSYLSLCCEMGSIEKISQASKFAMDQLKSLGISENDIIIGGYPTWLCKITGLDKEADGKNKNKDESKDDQ